MPDGDYQSCQGCHVYATCSNEILYDNRPCPADLVWDDNAKRCEWISTTCSDGGGSGKLCFLVVMAWRMATTKAVRVAMYMSHAQMKSFMIIVPAQMV